MRFEVGGRGLRLAAHFVRGQRYHGHAKEEHAIQWPQSVFSAEELASPPFRNARRAYAATDAHRGLYAAASRLARGWLAPPAPTPPAAVPLGSYDVTMVASVRAAARAPTPPVVESLDLREAPTITNARPTAWVPSRRQWPDARHQADWAVAKAAHEAALEGAL